MKIAVLSSDPHRAQEYLSPLSALPDLDPVTAGPDGWDEVLAQRPDAVVVTGELTGHRDLTTRLAEAGAPVLAEHPSPVATATAAVAKIDAAESAATATAAATAVAAAEAMVAAGIRLTFASPGRCGPIFAAVRRAITENKHVGELTTIHGAYHDSGRPGPALAGNAPVLLDMVESVLGGDPAVSVYAQVNTILSGDPEVDSAALLTVRHASGVVVSLDASWSPTIAATGPVMTFIGDRAGIEYTGRPRLLDGFDATTAGARWEPGGTDARQLMLAEFAAAVRDGEQPAGPDGAAGLRTLRIVEAAYASARTGQVVDL
ncbi:Gfo/Idh/MocA family protein [Actinacidiphila oryziradicis]|uniref:Gfo/Idh/MocA family oxidoreductase n=1 Tax=Actinacidiphila oryziradicis TaxID=2571141 RepID=A0A4U0S249_9ACTN|nr:Gfo/Idh/MocA family oxidoreductase [Actinacidiphila oryziradicis]TKA02926.1 Gfo/Idh/MocA family oxidoreductase [Actinacidiphila oryziradicis]